MNDLALFNNIFDVFADDRMPAINYKKVFYSPKVDVSESKDAYTLQMDMPGKSENDVDIELNNNVLTISSLEESEKEEKKEKSDKEKDIRWLIKERNSYKFSRSFTLPEDVDSEQLIANVKNGVLTVTMPRKALATPKKIAITCA